MIREALRPGGGGVKDEAIHGSPEGAISARPAGTAWSNVDDLLKYHVAMELAEGKLPDGKQHIAKDPLFARRIPNVAVGADAAYGMASSSTPSAKAAKPHHVTVQWSPLLHITPRLFDDSLMAIMRASPPVLACKSRTPAAIMSPAGSPAPPCDIHVTSAVLPQ